VKPALKDAFFLFHASKSLTVFGIHLINTASRVAKIPFRIKHFSTRAFNVHGVTFYANSSDGLGALALNHEPAVHAAVLKAAEAACETGVFLNIGAHIGRYALEYACFFSKTLAFEPTPATFRLLEKAVDLHPLKKRIEIYRACIGDRHGKVKFELKDDESQNSVLLEEAVGADQGAYSGKELIEVEMMPLDSLLPPSDWPQVKLILIDAEGAEALILSSGLLLLRESSSTIIVELLDDGAFSRCSSLLEPLGYLPKRLDKTNYQFTKA
jgi:FkbM family methyltransferase